MDIICLWPLLRPPLTTESPTRASVPLFPPPPADTCDMPGEARRSARTPSPPTMSEELSPPGWSVARRETPSGRKYKVYSKPGRPNAQSLKQAWKLHHEVEAAAAAAAAPETDSEVCCGCALAVWAPGNEMLLCDGPGCQGAYHLSCLSPPLGAVPEGNWLCPSCTRAATPAAASNANTNVASSGPPAKRDAHVPSAPQRKHRLVRLPEPNDLYIDKRLKVAVNGVWWTAKITKAVQCISYTGKGTTEYDVRFDKDGVTLQEDLQDPNYVFEFLSDGEPVDEFDERLAPKQVGTLTASSPKCLSNDGLTEDAALQPVLRLSAAKPQQLTPTTKRQRKSIASASSSEGTSTTQRVIVPRTEPLHWQPENAVSKAVTEAICAVLAQARDRSAASSDDLPIMRKLRATEWFAGSARLSFALALQHDWEVVVHDIDPDAIEWVQHDVQEDGSNLMYCGKEFISEVNIGSFYQQPPYDYFHYSIDCSSFSALGHAGQFRNAGNDYLGEHEACKLGNQMVHKMLDMINMQLDRNKNFLFTIENPQTGKFKDHPMVQAKLTAPREHGGLGATPVAVDFCWFKAAHEERPFKKRTMIWTNSPSLIRELGEHRPPSVCSRFLCERATPCPFFQQGHRPVAGNCAAATPFPRRLAELIARCITLDASVQRWRRL